MNRRIAFFYYCLFFIVFSLRASCQKYPAENEKNTTKKYLNRYFLSAEKESRSYDSLQTALLKYETISVWPIKIISRQLDEFEHLLVALNRHKIYLTLIHYDDRKDSEVKRKLKNVNSEIGKLRSYISEKLNQPPYTNLLEKDMNSLGLTRFRYLLSSEKNARLHTLNKHDEEFKSRLTDPILEGLDDRYSQLISVIEKTPVSLPDGRVDTIKNIENMLKDTSSGDRSVAAKTYYSSYQKHRELIASILIDNTRVLTLLATIHGFKSAPERFYDRRLQSGETAVKEFLQNITSHAGILKDYQKTLAEEVKKTTGLKTVHSWDLYFQSGYHSAILPFDSVRSLILEAITPLGNKYSEEFHWLLNNNNGTLDISGGPDRVNEFTSLGFPGVPTTLYMKSYTGELSDIITLVHEGGHAIHRQLMNENNIVPSYASGPNFLFEGFAIFNELLLLDYLQKKSKSTAEKAFYCKQFTDVLALEIFTSAEEGIFEQDLYEGVSKQELKTENDIDSLYMNIMHQYDYFIGYEPERNSEWIQKRLLFDDPLYNVNYLYAVLVACKLFDLLKTDPEAFPKKYLSLLQHGFDAPADLLLQQFMGFGLNQNSLLQNAFELMGEKTKELKFFYEH